MSVTTPITTPRQRLWLPRLSLAGCVRAAMLRDTTGLELTESQRHNHFPATPLVSLSWWFSGRSVMLGDEVLPMPGPFVFAGPFTRPSVSFNDGPVHAMMLVLMPDALRALTGIDAKDHVNRLSDARTLLPAPWLAMCEAVQAASDDDTRLQLIEDFLQPLWTAADPGTGPFLRYHDWVQAVALRAATSPAGRSLRQVERRIKQWAGLSLRELRAFSRAERAFAQVTAAVAEGPVNWAEQAEAAGYADQSHLCRETRRVTGFSPEDLRRRIEQDESFWVYRLWE